MEKEQSAELAMLFSGVKNAGNLDYVTGWYKKAAEYIQGTQIECAFISIFARGVHINFAHQTFKRLNEARGNTAVYCIIVGFSLRNRTEKQLFLYDDIKGEPKAQTVKRINAYLADAQNVFIDSRSSVLDTQTNPMVFNSMSNDGGNLIIEENEYTSFLQQERKRNGISVRFWGRKCLSIIRNDIVSGF